MFLQLDIIYQTDFIVGFVSSCIKGFKGADPSWLVLV